MRMSLASNVISQQNYQRAYDFAGSLRFKPKYHDVRKTVFLGLMINKSSLIRWTMERLGLRADFFAGDLRGALFFCSPF